MPKTNSKAALKNLLDDVGQKQESKVLEKVIKGTTIISRRLESVEQELMYFMRNAAVKLSVLEDVVIETNSAIDKDVLTERYIAKSDYMSGLVAVDRAIQAGDTVRVKIASKKSGDAEFGTAQPTQIDSLLTKSGELNDTQLWEGVEQALVGAVKGQVVDVVNLQVDSEVDNKESETFDFKVTVDRILEKAQEKSNENA